MRKFFILLLSLTIAFVSVAQGNLPPILEIRSDSLASVSLDTNQSQILEDYTGKLTLSQVSQLPVENNFHSFSSSIFNLSVEAYWFRYRIKNEMSHPTKICVPTGSGYCDLFATNGDGKWDHYKNGWLVPWSKRNGLKSITQIELTLKTGEEFLIYQRERITYFAFIKPQLEALEIGFSDSVIRRTYVDSDSWIILYPLVFLIIGVCILGAVFNLFFYRAVQEKLYLYFSLFLLSVAIMLFFEGDGPLNPGTAVPFFREFPLSLNAIFFISFDLLWFCFIYFARYYLETINYYPKLDKGLKLFGWYYLVIVIAPFLIPFLSDGWNKILVILQLLLMRLLAFLLFITFLFYISKTRSNRIRLVYALPLLFFLGCVDPLLDISYLILAQFYGIPPPGWIIWITRGTSFFFLISLIVLVVFFSLDLFQRFRTMQKRIVQQTLEKEIEKGQLIERQKVELEKTVQERTAELRKSLQDLKISQTQLIQSEKMASLGELTAGIAHEIQNPLNFVNNFSDVNSELVDELEQEIDQGKYLDAKETARSIKDNEQKINHHGKRADSIVKGMLQHSRTGSGTKEPSDINRLADEYLRLAYQGFRARDKSFNATFSTEFDNTIDKVNIVPQDIGRVILNLINNAFYAVNEKKKSCELSAMSYEPLVIVQTRKLHDKIEIVVKDNGNGIPEPIKEKIFQPFFTTKATGQGTGLGLSLAYDIVKAHGGEIKVQSKEGEGSEFIIQLPA